MALYQGLAVAETRVRSLLWLQILLYINVAYFVFWWLAEVAMFVWKDYAFPYPSENFDSEVALLCILVPLFGFHFFFVSKGNLTQRTATLVLGVAITAAVFVVFLFFTLWQTYVLRGEFIIGIIALVVTGTELLLAIAAAFSFAQPESISR